MKGIFKTLSMVILLAALIGAGVLVKRNQETRRGATAAETSAQILPDKVETKAGQTFTVNVWLNTGKNTDKLRGAEFRLAFDPAKVVYVSSAAQNGYTIITEDSEGGADRLFKMVAMGEEKSGAVNVVKLTFRAVSDGASTIIVGEGATIMVADQTVTWDVAKSSGTKIQTGAITVTVTSKVVGEGEMCGGIRGMVCAPGLTCRYPVIDGIAGRPTISMTDRSGTCISEGKKTAKEGQMCGGIAGIMCATGLKCEYGLMPEKLPGSTSSASRINPDQSGICVKENLTCKWCGTGCIDASLKIACTTIAPPTGKSCTSVNGKCTVVPNVTPTPWAACGSRCTQNQQCQGGMTCAPIWWPCGPMPLTAMNKVQTDQGLSQTEVAEMIRICPTVKGVMPSGYESMGVVKMPTFYGVCRNPKCVSSTNCSCSPTPTPSVVPQCTPVLCKPGEGLYCPVGANGCVGGCGYKCGTPTPTTSVNGKLKSDLFIWEKLEKDGMFALGENARVGVQFNVPPQNGYPTAPGRVSVINARVNFDKNMLEVVDIMIDNPAFNNIMKKEIDNENGLIWLYVGSNKTYADLSAGLSLATITFKTKAEGKAIIGINRSLPIEMTGVDDKGMTISYDVKVGEDKFIMVGQSNTCQVCKNGATKKSGDANCDRQMNSIDFEIWRSEMFDQGGLSGTVKSTWQSDYNCDQKVSGVDFEIWRKTVFQ